MRVSYLLVLLALLNNLFATFSLDEIVELSKQNTAEDRTIHPPNPLHLEPNWWEFYETDNQKLEKRITLTEDFFLHLLDQTKDGKEETEEYIQRILINLKALPKAREQKVSTFYSYPFKNSYNFDELLEKIAKKNELEGKIEEQRKEVAQLKDRSQKIRQQLDLLFAAYLGLKEENISKLLAGLEIISLKMVLAITDENYRVINDRFSLYTKELVHINKEITQASNKLVVENLDVQQLESDIEDAYLVLKNTQVQSLNSEMKSLGNYGESPLEKAKGFLNSQKAVLDVLKEALAKMNVIFHQAKKNLLMSVAHLDGMDQNLPEYIVNWKEQIDEINKQIPDWKAKTEREYERVLQPNESSENIELEKIRQLRLQIVQDSIKQLYDLKLHLSIDRLISEELNDRLQVKEGKTSFWAIFTTKFIENCCEPVFDWLHTPLVIIGGIPITLLNLLRMLLIIGFTFLLSSLIRKFVKNINKEKVHLTSGSVFIIDKVIHYALLFIGFALAFISIGLNLSNLAIVLGALSVGIGFGLQTIVNNFLSSLIIMFSRTIKVGDIVELLDGRQGEVSEINIQNTFIHTRDGVDIVIPNSEILGNKLTNWTLKDNFKRLHIPFSVAYGTDKDLVTQIVCEAATKVPCTVLNSPHFPNPQVWLIDFAKSSLDFELIVWVNVYGYGHKGSMNSSYLWEIDTALQKNSIEVPFPQVEVRYSNKETDESLQLN